MSKSAPTSKTKSYEESFLSRSLFSPIQKREVSKDITTQSEIQSKKEKFQPVSKSQETFIEKLINGKKKLEPIYLIGLILGTLLLFLIFLTIWQRVSPPYSQDMHLDSSYSKTDHPSSRSKIKYSNKIPIQVRCGNPYFKGVFGANSWLDYFFSSACPRNLGLDLFRLDSSLANEVYSSGNDYDELEDDQYDDESLVVRMNRRNVVRAAQEPYVSFGNLLVIEFLYPKNVGIRSIQLYLPKGQTELYLKNKIMIRLYGQRENEKGSSLLLEGNLHKGLLESKKRFDSFTFGCISDSCLDRYNKFRLEIESKEQTDHKILRLIVY